jgi:hypothetical protein
VAGRGADFVTAEPGHVAESLGHGIGRDDVIAYLRLMADRCAPGDRMWLFHAAHMLYRDQTTVFVPLTFYPGPMERHGDQAI